MSETQVAANTLAPDAQTASETPATTLTSMDIKKILDYLPHRYPFIMIDKIEELCLGKSVKAIKNVTINEPYFMGHFPGQPIMPGVLILESMAQAMGVLALITIEHKEGLSHASALHEIKESLHYFARIDEGRFFSPVVPGDRLDIEITEVKNRRDLWKAQGYARVDGKVVCSAKLTVVKTEVIHESN